MSGLMLSVLHTPDPTRDPSSERVRPRSRKIQCVLDRAFFRRSHGRGASAARGLFTCQLMLSFTEESHRFCPEPLSWLLNLLALRPYVEFLYGLRALLEKRCSQQNVPLSCFFYYFLSCVSPFGSAFVSGLCLSR